VRTPKLSEMKQAFLREFLREVLFGVRCVVASLSLHSHLIDVSK
jgi:hypothetical protein